jgi:hypothetical protein
MPLNKSIPDDFLWDDAKTPQQRRIKLIEHLTLDWATEDIEEIERVVKKKKEGWAMWRHNPGDPWRQL